VYTATGTLCLGNLLLQLIPSLEGHDAFSFAWLAVFALAAVGGLLLPSARYRQLHKWHSSFRALMIANLRGSSTPADVEALPPPAARTSENIRKLTAGIAAARYRASRMPLAMGTSEHGEAARDGPSLGKLLHSSSSTGGAEDSSGTITSGATLRRIFGGALSCDVELMVRLELQASDSVAMRRRHRRELVCCRNHGVLVPTTAGIERCLWLFTQGIDEFEDDVDAIAVIKMEYARFLRAYTSDFTLAMAALDSVEKDVASFDAKFLIQKAKESLASLRSEREHGDVVNEAGLQQYTMELDEAIQDHEKALVARRRLFTHIKRVQGSLNVNDKAAAERMGALIDTSNLYVEKASRRYDRLLREHPRGKHLGTIYAKFCTDVLADPELASMYDTTERSEEASAYSSGSRRSGSVGGSPGSVHGAKSRRELVPKTRSQDVATMGRQFRFGVFMLLVLVCAATIAEREILSSLTSLMRLVPSVAFGGACYVPRRCRNGVGRVVVRLPQARA